MERITMWTINRFPFHFYSFSKYIGIFHLNYDAEMMLMVKSNEQLFYGCLFILSSFVVCFLSASVYMNVDRLLGVVHWQLLDLVLFVNCGVLLITQFSIYLWFLIKSDALCDLLNEGLSIFREFNATQKYALYEYDSKFIIVLALKTLIGSMPIVAVIHLYFWIPETMGDTSIQQNLQFVNQILLAAAFFQYTSFYFCGILHAAHLIRLLNLRLKRTMRQISDIGKLSVTQCCRLSDEIDDINALYTRICHFTQIFSAFNSPVLLSIFICKFVAMIVEVGDD